MKNTPFPSGSAHLTASTRSDDPITIDRTANTPWTARIERGMDCEDRGAMDSGIEQGR